MQIKKQKIKKENAVLDRFCSGIRNIIGNEFNMFYQIMLPEAEVLI